MKRKLWTGDTRRMAGWLRVAAALLLTVALAACKGQDGPAGQDGVSPDVSPPAVALLSPLAGDTVRDTLRMVVNAVDNVGIDRVTFFLDGSDQIDDTTFAEVTSEGAVNSQYVYEFNLVELEVENGPHALMARAYDVDGNHSDTPPVIVYSLRLVHPGPAVLRAWDPDSTGFYIFPNRSVIDTSSIDTLHNVRLVPERDCVVDSVRFYLSGDAVANLNYDTQLIISLYESDGIYPLMSNRLASTSLDVTGLDSTGWFSTAFTGLDRLRAGEIVHVAITADTLSNTTKFAIGTAIVKKYGYPVYNHSSRYRLDGLPHWESLQNQYAAEARTREFMIELWVNYLE